MTAKKIVNKPASKRRGNPNWKKGGPSPNPKGAPKRGESWEELIKKVGDMTPPEAAEMSLELAKDYLKLGEGITLKQAVVLSVYRALLHDPQPGLFNAIMERAEGKVADKLLVTNWRDVLKQVGVDSDQVFAEVIDTVIPRMIASPTVIDIPLPAALQEAEIDDVPPA